MLPLLPVIHTVSFVSLSVQCFSFVDCLSKERKKERKKENDPPSYLLVLRKPSDVLELKDNKE